MSELGRIGPDGRTAFPRLDAALEHALRPWSGSRRELALLFSGGVDSALLAWELRALPGLGLVTVGVPGSPDLVAAESAARELGLRWSGARVAPEEIRAIGRRIAPETEGAGRVGRSVLTALALALERAGPEVVLCGQGADELFLGYAHYRGLGPAEAESRSAEDRRRLTDEDWPRSERIAARFGKTIAAPYLDPTFVREALSVPIEERMPLPVPKSFFRSWARHRGLPEGLAGRPKRAMQYGSGVDQALRGRD